MKHVIIIDDDVDLLHALLEALPITMKDVQTHGATSGEDGLKLVEIAPRPAVVLLDMRMPGMDGVEVLKKILEIRDSGIDVILMTADSPKKYKELMEAGCTLLAKPFDLPRLEDAIKHKLAKLA
jgi:DNA-binding NtrC family response regulator